ncbi:hypothetical protein ASG90_16255 [Nocardioides sp. Soil797]|nr:hypothetical protein ASG90_16255 [Nocardioides sp. Soil797]
MDLEIAMWIITATLLAMFLNGKARRFREEPNVVHQLLMSWLVILMAVTGALAVVLTVRDVVVTQDELTEATEFQVDQRSGSTDLPTPDEIVDAAARELGTDLHWSRGPQPPGAGDGQTAGESTETYVIGLGEDAPADDGGNGPTVCLQITSAPVTDANGQPTGLAWHTADVTPGDCSQ